PLVHHGATRARFVARQSGAAKGGTSELGGSAMSDTTQAPARSRKGITLGSLSSISGPLIGLILLCIFFSLTSQYFLSARNALNVLDQVTVLGILAVGMTLVIVIGGIDLSVG